MKSMFDGKMAKITVNPSLKTVIDQNVDIFVRNLPSHQDITLRARAIDDSETVFESFAYYKADENGEVSLVSQASLGGSYTGVEPMGLFWSMEPVEGTDRDDMLRKRDVTKPLKVSVDVYSGIRIGGNNSMSLEENNKLASVTLLRSYMSDRVTRHVVENGGFYGTFFIPSGDGLFPGVIDIWGFTGGLREDRTALLAANGFAVLALAYCAFKDLPERYGLLQVSYFESAIDWLTSQPKVKSGGVGLVGLSNGGTLALALAAQLGHKVKEWSLFRIPHANWMFIGKSYHDYTWLSC
ncbi:myristoyl-CoA hydrolase [Porites harrisoni]